MHKSAYAQKLLDPRWQKLRLAVLKRDDFTCQRCGNKEETLHVHHCYYISGRSPWEYPPQSLLTLCHGCHGREKDTGGLEEWESEEWEVLFKVNIANHPNLLDFLCEFSRYARVNGITEFEALRHITQSLNRSSSGIESAQKPEVIV